MDVCVHTYIYIYYIADMSNIFNGGLTCTGVLISPYPDQEGNNLRLPKV